MPLCFSSRTSLIFFCLGVWGLGQGKGRVQPHVASWNPTVTGDHAAAHLGRPGAFAAGAAGIRLECERSTGCWVEEPAGASPVDELHDLILQQLNLRIPLDIVGPRRAPRLALDLRAKGVGGPRGWAVS